MKFLKIILLLFILISPSNANTIYNLIKIPNLEIYKNNSLNDIKYLKAIKPFQVGIRDDNVTCFNSSDKTIKNNFDLIEKNLNKYDTSFLKKINLKYVVLCEDLKVAEIKTAGVPNHKVKTLIVDINFDKRYFERSIHHEIFHMIDDSYKELFSYEKWEEFNTPKFKYAECSTCTNKLDLSLINKSNGFLTEYSMSTASEDMAELFSFLMTDSENLKKILLKDPILTKKTLFLKNTILKIDNNFKFN